MLHPALNVQLVVVFFDILPVRDKFTRFDKMQGAAAVKGSPPNGSTVRSMGPGLPAAASWYVIWKFLSVFGISFITLPSFIWIQGHYLSCFLYASETLALHVNKYSKNG